AGVTNTDIVKDPTGFITHRSVVTVPFDVNEADIEATVVMLTDLPVVDLYVDAPSGDRITPANAAGVGVEYGDAGARRYYRFVLPVALAGGQQTGTWRAVLELDETRFRRYCREDHPKGELGPTPCSRNGARYSVSAMAWSNLRMRATLHQDSMEPGALLTVRARLDEYGVPVDSRASVRTELTWPDGTKTVHALSEVQPGVFQVSVVTSQAGVYRFHVLAVGVTMRGAPFTREQLLTGAVFSGGDQPLPTGAGGTSPWCCLLERLLQEDSVVALMRHFKLDPVSILRRLAGCCGRAGQRR
ncbi:MAG TPA: hypothetical protein VG963_11640, partial [Polyangiaceae bacterium]|nr:hypothetical protein [Polyangiaceae bacterium]